MTEAKSFLLPRIGERGEIADGMHQFGLGLFAAAFEEMLQLGGVVEVIFDGRLAAPRDDDYVFNFGGQALFDDVLNSRLVYERQHLLGNDLTPVSGEKPRSQPCRGDDGFAYALDWIGHREFFRVRPSQRRASMHNTERLLGLSIGAFG